MENNNSYIEDIEEWINSNTIGYEDDVQTSAQEQHEEDINALDKLRGDSILTPRIKISNKFNLITRFIVIILVSVAIVTIFIKTRYHPVTVVGASMSPTLEDGDILRTITEITEDKISYDSIICFRKNNGQLIIKRVVGLPGDKISFKDGNLYINGILQDDGFPLMNEFPKGEIILKNDEFYCLGDNRNNSMDSRVLGPVKFSEICNIVRYDSTKEKEKMKEARNLIDEYKKSTSTDAE